MILILRSGGSRQVPWVLWNPPFTQEHTGDRLTTQLVIVIRSYWADVMQLICGQGSLMACSLLRKVMTIFFTVLEPPYQHSWICHCHCIYAAVTPRTMHALNMKVPLWNACHSNLGFHMLYHAVCREYVYSVHACVQHNSRVVLLYSSKARGDDVT